MQALRDIFGGACVANSGGDRQKALATTAFGHAEMIAFGTPFIGNPDLVARLRENTLLFEAPASAFFGGGAEGCMRFNVTNPSTEGAAA